MTAVPDATVKDNFWINVMTNVFNQSVSWPDDSPRIQGVKSRPTLLSPHLPRFMTIPFHHTLTHVQGKETAIKISRNTIGEEEKTFSICRVDKGRYRRRMEKEEQRFIIKYFWMKQWGAKRIHQQLVTRLGDDIYGVSQLKE
jgi:hypothetical protein